MKVHFNLKNLAILITLGIFVSTASYADSVTQIKVNIKNQYLFGSEVRLVPDSLYPTNAAFYCTLIPEVIKTSNSFIYGICNGAAATATPSMPKIAYALYKDKDSKTPLLTCQLNYTAGSSGCQADAVIIPSAKADVPATCSAQVSAPVGNQCGVDFVFGVSSK